MVGVIRRINGICLAVDLSALAAHVLALPNKLRLDGPLWLAVQQELRWELGHAGRALLAVAALGCLLSAARRDRDR
jgi:hypothetical protein